MLTLTAAAQPPLAFLLIKSFMASINLDIGNHTIKEDDIIPHIHTSIHTTTAQTCCFTLTTKRKFSCSAWQHNSDPPAAAYSHFRITSGLLDSTQAQCLNFYGHKSKWCMNPCGPHVTARHRSPHCYLCWSLKWSWFWFFFSETTIAVQLTEHSLIEHSHQCEVTLSPCNRCIFTQADIYQRPEEQKFPQKFSPQRRHLLWRCGTPRSSRLCSGPCSLARAPSPQAHLCQRTSALVRASCRTAPSVLGSVQKACPAVLVHFCLCWFWISNTCFHSLGKPTASTCEKRLMYSDALLTLVWPARCLVLSTQASSPPRPKPKHASLVPLASQVERRKYGEGLKPKSRRRLWEIEEIGL